MKTALTTKEIEINSLKNELARMKYSKNNLVSHKEVNDYQHLRLSNISQTILEEMNNRDDLYDMMNDLNFTVDEMININTFFAYKYDVCVREVMKEGRNIAFCFDDFTNLVEELSGLNIEPFVDYEEFVGVFEGISENVVENSQMY